MADASGLLDPVDAQTNLGPVVVAVILALFGITTVFVILREITRIFITKDFGYDDVAVIFSWASISVGKALMLMTASNGLGKHIRDVPPESYKKFLKYDYLNWDEVSLGSREDCWRVFLLMRRWLVDCLARCVETRDRAFLTPIDAVQSVEISDLGAYCVLVPISRAVSHRGFVAVYSGAQILEP